MCRLIYQLRGKGRKRVSGGGGKPAAEAFFGRFCAKQDIFCGASQSLQGLQAAKNKAAASGDTAALYTSLVSL